MINSNISNHLLFKVCSRCCFKGKIKLLFVIIGLVSFNKAISQQIFQQIENSNPGKWMDAFQPDSISYISVGDVNSGGYKVKIQKTDLQGNRQWFKTYGIDQRQLFFGGMCEENPNEIIVASILDSAIFNKDIVISAFDSSGNIIHAKRLIAPLTDWVNDIAVIDINQYMCGYYYNASTSPPYHIQGLLAYNNNVNNVSWVKYVNHPEDLRFTKILATSGGILICGSVGNNSMGQFDVIAIMMDTLGNVSWTKRYQAESGYSVRIYDVIEDYDGNYILAGDYYGLSGSANPWFQKIDLNGNVMWAKSMSGFSSFGESKLIKNDGGYWAVFTRGYIIRMSSSFYPIITYIIEQGFTITNLRFIKSTLDRGFLIGGSNYASNAWLIKADSTMNAGCYQTGSTALGGNKNVSVIPITIVDSLVSSASIPISLTSYTSNQVFSISCQTATGIEATEERSIQIDPNPFKDRVTVRSNDLIESISIFNLSGQKISHFMKDNHEINLESLAPGIYLLRIEMGKGKIDHQKIIKL